MSDPCPNCGAEIRVSDSGHKSSARWNSECAGKCTGINAWGETRSRARDAFISTCVEEGLWAYAKAKINAHKTASQSATGGAT